MFVGITNTPRDYTWGSKSAIAGLLSREPSGGPEAELWFGAHPLAPSRIVDPAAHDGHETLDAWIAADPTRALGANRTSDTLPFLLKILAAEEPLSIQAHPSPEQAKAGFARESGAGIPLEAAERMYKDDRHKPELVFALSDTFEALAGFRDVSFTRLLVEELELIARAGGSREDAHHLRALGDLFDRDDESALRAIVAFALDGTDDARATTEAVVRAARRAPKVSSYQRELRTLIDLQERHPGDPGILVALLMNRISLPQGQALYLPSGNIHAYLRGVAVEIMAASDNVMRGGLTTKHIDTGELQKVVRFQPVPAPYLMPVSAGRGVEAFRPDVDDFQLLRVDVGAAGERHGYELAGPPSVAVPLPGPGILLSIGGEAAVAGAASSTVLGPGGAAFVTPDEAELEISGSDTVFLATVNR